MKLNSSYQAIKEQIAQEKFKGQYDSSKPLILFVASCTNQNQIVKRSALFRLLKRFTFKSLDKVENEIRSNKCYS